MAEERRVPNSTPGTALTWQADRTRVVSHAGQRAATLPIRVRDATFYASSLLELHNLSGAPSGARRGGSRWRRSPAPPTEDGPGPLEGLHPNALVAGVRAALQAGLADDLDWLAPAAAGVRALRARVGAAARRRAARARPPRPRAAARGRRRDVRGHRATHGARRRARASAAAGMRARIALVAELPIGARRRRRPARAGPRVAARPRARVDRRAVDRVAALAPPRGAAHRAGGARGRPAGRAGGRPQPARLQGRRRAARVGAPARGPRVARLAARRRRPRAAGALGAGAREGDRGRARADALAHRVAARRRVDRGLRRRRARARRSSSPQRAVSQGLLERDPGAAAAFLWGLPRAADAEPEAAMELLDLVLAKASADIGEAAVDLRTELGESRRGRRKALGAGARAARRATEGQQATTGPRPSRSRCPAISRAPRATTSRCARRSARALDAFAAQGAREAYALARDVLSAAARGSVDALEAVSPEEDGAEGRAGSIARRTSLAVLRDLDMSLLEQRRPRAPACRSAAARPRAASTRRSTRLRDRMAEWILAREGQPLDAPARQRRAVPAHPTLSMRRLRALLHLADGDVGDDDERPAAGRAPAQALPPDRARPARRGSSGARPRPCAARSSRRSRGRSTRSCASGAATSIDVLPLVARHVVDPGELRTLAEAAMDPELVHVLERYAVFAERARGRGRRGAAGARRAARETWRSTPRAAARRCARCSCASAARSRAIRRAGRCARSRPPGGSRARGRRRRWRTALGVARAARAGARGAPRSGARARRSPSAAAASAHRGRRARAVGADAARSARRSWPPRSTRCSPACPRRSASLVTSDVVWRSPICPRRAAMSDAAAEPARREALPAWLPPRRTIGGFYVLRALGARRGRFGVRRHARRGQGRRRAPSASRSRSPSTRRAPRAA